MANLVNLAVSRIKNVANKLGVAPLLNKQTIKANVRAGAENVAYNFKTNLQNLSSQATQPKFSESVADQVSNLKSPFLSEYARFVPNYLGNQYVAPIAQVPEAIRQIKQPGLLNKGVGGLRVLGGVATAIPDPIQDLAYPAAKFLIGANKYENRGKGFKQNLVSGLRSASWEEPAGLGDVFFKDPAKREIGNLAELPLIIFAPGTVKKINAGRLKNAEAVLKDSDNIIKAINKLEVFDMPNIRAHQKILYLSEATEVAKKHIPEVLNSKEMKRLATGDPKTWAKTVKTFLEDRLVTASNPPKTKLGQSIRHLSKFPEEPKAPKGSLYDTKGEFPLKIREGSYGVSKYPELSDQKLVDFAKKNNIVVKKTGSNVYELISPTGKKIEAFGREVFDHLEEMYKRTPNVTQLPKAKGGMKNLEVVDIGQGSTTKWIIRGKNAKGEIQPFNNNSYTTKADALKAITTSNVAQLPLSDTTKLTGSKLGEDIEKGLPKKVKGFSPSLEAQKLQQGLSQTKKIKGKGKAGSLNDIISLGRKQIGGSQVAPKTSVKQDLDNFYTQWVDRYNPLVKASKKAQKSLKGKATLLPQRNPEYLVRRLTGAGGIADYRFRTELQPVLKEIETSGIPRIDIDTYLANKRIAGFGSVERTVYGADPIQASEIVQALDQKYGPELAGIAEKLYKYQDKGFQEIIDAGFVSPKDAQIIKSQNPDYSPLYRVMDEMNDYLGLPTRKTMQGSQPIKKIKGSKRQIVSPLESIVGNTFKQRAAIEKNRVAQSVVDLQQIVDMGFEKMAKSSNETITVWRNGEKEYWKVGRDIADVAKGANEEAMNLVLRVLREPAALLRQGATGRNPEFMIPNIVRDQLDAGITSKYGYIPFIDYVSGLRSMLTNDDVYKKWQSSGAKIALGEMSGQKTLKKLQETATSKKGLFRKLSSILDWMGKYSEEPTRVGLFRKAYRKTGNEMLALLESRDATVDFARMGSKMKVANSIIPFLNVQVQGFDKLIRAVKNNPGKVLLGATLYGAVPAITSTLYNLANYPEEYSEIPQYEKDSNFVIVKGRNENGNVDYITFPKGNILPVIANPIESFVNFSFENDQQSFAEMAMQSLTSVLPVVGEGQSPQEIGLKTVGGNLPQIFKPITENILNKSFYKYDPKKEQTKEIVPYYLQDKEPYKQDYKFTPKMYKAIGAVLNASPLKVKNLMEGYLAGYAKIPAQIIEMLSKTSRGEEITPNDKTILRRFFKQTYSSSTSKAKKTEKQRTPLMERITGKAQAAEETDAYTEEDVDDAKYELKNSDKTKIKVGNRIYYQPEGWQTGDDIKSVKLEWEEPKLPEIKESEPWDNAWVKDQISDYKSDISRRQNDIMQLYELGELSYNEAMEEYMRLDKLKKTATDKVTKPKAPKKPKKITIPKVSLPKTTKLKSAKIKRVSLREKPMKKAKFRSKL